MINSHIKTRLSRIEEEENVTILYACESGSRAWGFESADSDYDVRFIYLRRTPWYLTIEQGRDVIERPLDEHDIDMSGWDLLKALELFRRSNPPLLFLGEWGNEKLFIWNIKFRLPHLAQEVDEQGIHQDEAEAQEHEPPEVLINRLLDLEREIQGDLEELLDMISVPKTAAGLKGAFKFSDEPDSGEAEA